MSAQTMSSQSTSMNSSTSQSQPSNQNSAPSSFPGCLSRSSSKHRPTRRRSLRLSNQPIHIPIPPSLLESPYLNSPESIFQRAVTSPRHPSKEDEQWLQDTVPLSVDGREEGERRPRSMELPLGEAVRGEHPRGRPTEKRSMSPHPTPSPPVRWRHPIFPPPAGWIGQATIRSAPIMTEQGYFVATA